MTPNPIALDNGDIKICTVCVEKKLDIGKDVNKKVITDSNVCFVYRNMPRGPLKDLIAECIKQYSEKQIVNAKSHLLSEFEEILNELDDECMSDIRKNRRETKARSLSEISARDIHDCLQLLEGYNIKYVVEPADDKQIHLITSIHKNEYEINARVSAIESRLSAMDSVCQDTTDLKQQVCALIARLNEADKKLADMEHENKILKVEIQNNCVSPIPAGKDDRGEGLLVRDEGSGDEVKGQHGAQEPLPTGNDDRGEGLVVRGEGSGDEDGSRDEDEGPQGAQEPLPADSSQLPLPTTQGVADVTSTTASSVDSVTNGNSMPFQQQLNAKQRRKQNNATRQAALKITAEAVANGTSIDSAMTIGNIVANDKNRSYSNITKQGTVGRPVRPVPTNISDSNRQVGGFGNRKKLSKTSPYIEGKNAGTESSIAAARPVWHNTKCLVISGIDKRVTQTEFIEDMNKKAGKK